MFKGKEKVTKYVSILIFAVIILFLSYFRIFEVFELQTLDLRFKLRPPQETSSDIVIIEIAKDTLDKIGSWPFSRKYHGLLVEALHKAGAKQIIFDILFAEETEEDDFFAGKCKKAGNVYFAHSFEIEEKGQGSIKAVNIEDPVVKKLKRSAKATGFINITPDIDGKYRKVPLYIKYKDKYHRHLSYKAVCDYLNLKVEDIDFIPGKYLSLSDKVNIPINARNEIFINFADKWGKAFKHYSFIDIVGSYILEAKGKEPIIDLSKFKDKVCIVGVTATGGYDLQSTPLAVRYPGVGIHANLYNCIVVGDFLVRADKLVNLIILIVLLSIVVSIAFRSKIKASIFYLAGALVFYVALSIATFTYFGVWIDVFYPVLISIVLYLAIVIYKLIIEKHQRELLSKELSIAQRIQQSFLPEDAPKIEGLDIASSMKAAKSVGGDLYQFTQNQNKLGILIADVSGKGIPAALFMVKVISEFKAKSQETFKPDQLLNSLNTQLVKGAKTGLFVTCSYLVIDILKKSAELSDAGHLPLIHYKEKEKAIKEVRPKKGMPIGLMLEADFEIEKLQLSKADALVFYTDGAIEARNLKGEEFGLTRLKDAVSRLHSKDALSVLEGIKDDILNFQGKAPAHDDLTLVVVKVL